MGFLDWLRGSTPRKTEELLAKARALATELRVQDAVDTYSRIPQCDRTPDILLEMAWACLSAAQPMTAAEYAKQILKLDPTCAEAMCIQGEVLLRENRRSQALARFREALRLDPGCGRASIRVNEVIQPPQEEAGRRDEGVIEVSQGV